MPHPSLIVAGVVVAVGLAALFLARSPHQYTYVLIGYVLFVPKLAIVQLPGTQTAIRGEDLLMLLLAIKLALDFTVGEQRLNRHGRGIAAAVGVLLPIGVAGMIIGAQLGLFQSALLPALFLARRFQYALLFLAGFAYIGTSRKRVRTLLGLVEASVYWNALLAFAQAAGLAGAWNDGVFRPDATDRVMGTFGNPTEFGGFAVIGICLILGKVVQGRHAVLRTLGLLATIWAVWLSQARIALASIVFVVAVYLIREIGPSTRARLAGTLAPLLILLALNRERVLGILGQGRFETVNVGDMLSATAAAWARRDFSGLGQHGILEGASRGIDLAFAARIDRWFDMVDGVLRYSPIVGLGPSSGGDAVDNNYLRILIEFGIAGAILYGVLIALIIRCVRSVPDGILKTTVSWGGVGLLIQALLIDVFEMSKIATPVWLLLGVCAAVLTRETLTGAQEPNASNKTRHSPDGTRAAYYAGNGTDARGINPDVRSTIRS